MVTQFNEKGKIFTQVISKLPVPVTVQTIRQMIRGDLHVRPNDRLKDEMNNSEQFIAITNAIIYGDKGQEIFRSGFITINTAHIVWLIPDEEIKPPEVKNE